MTHQTIDNDINSLITKFLSGGDTYGYSYGISRNKSLSVSTSHSLDVQKQKWNFKVNSSFKYAKNNNVSNLSSATFSEYTL